MYYRRGITIDTSNYELVYTSFVHRFTFIRIGGGRVRHLRGQQVPEELRTGSCIRRDRPVVQHEETSIHQW